jgi:hypothetical protein
MKSIVAVLSSSGRLIGPPGPSSWIMRDSMSWPGVGEGGVGLEPGQLLGVPQQQEHAVA